MFGNFVFDIDGAMTIAVDSYRKEEIHQEIVEAYGEAFVQRHLLMASGYPHYVFPGYYALFQWLHSLGGKLFFFSSGVEERNVEFAAHFMQRAFGEAPPPYKVFSRHSCVNTERIYPREEGKKYQPVFYGRLKKKLAGVVVPEEELPHTLLIEDDSSYMTKGEEYNLVCLRYCMDYLFRGWDWKRRSEAFIKFHRAYYLAGMLKAIFDLREAEGKTLLEASKILQLDREGQELSQYFHYPSVHRLTYFLQGKAVLDAFDPSLTFHYDMPEVDDSGKIIDSW